MVRPIERPNVRPSLTASGHAATNARELKALASNSRARAPCRRSWRLRGRILPASGQADDGNEWCPGGCWRDCTIKSTANPTMSTTEMDVCQQLSMAIVRWIFCAQVLDSAAMAYLLLACPTQPGTSTLTRPSNVLWPDKKHPASARALEPRLPRSWLPWPRRFRPISRSLPSDAAIWLS